MLISTASAPSNDNAATESTKSRSLWHNTPTRSPGPMPCADRNDEAKEHAEELNAA